MKAKVHRPFLRLLNLACIISGLKQIGKLLLEILITLHEGSMIILVIVGAKDSTIRETYIVTLLLYRIIRF